jgi:acetyl-CoA synthetase
MDAEDPLFILYRFHWKTQRNGAYYSRIYGVPAYTFKNVFNYEDNDIFWCTADIGWITGHILYGPLLNGATTVILKVPYPDYSRFGKLLLNTK